MRMWGLLLGGALDRVRQGCPNFFTRRREGAKRPCGEAALNLKLHRALTRLTFRAASPRHESFVSSRLHVKPCDASIFSSISTSRRSNGKGSERRDRGRPMAKPLKVVRVLDMGTFITGPAAGVLLADLGAEVIKVEMPGTGDPFRAFKGDLYSPHYQTYNRNKKSIELNTK